MTNRKNHNSIIFLTTLGVYLGLLLVGGATPQVYAHAAMTRNFEIQDEIEIKDNLDKKPSTDDDLDKAVKAADNIKIVEALRAFFADLRKLESIGKFDPKEDLVFDHKLWLEEFGTTNTSSKNSGISNPWLETAVSEMIAKASNWDTTEIADWLQSGCEGRDCRKTSIQLTSTSSDFVLKFGFEKSSSETAKAATARFAEIFKAKKALPENKADLPLYEGIQCLSDANQIFIVTRLARASIDPLLAKDAK